MFALLLLAPALQATAELGWRFDAPFRFRFIVQPLIAILLGFRDGRVDAKLSAAPYLSALIFTPADRQRNLKEGLSATWKPMALGMILDAVVQVSFLDSFHPLQALLVGVLLVGLPYVISRDVTNRLVTRH